jgi:biopolymer transport protein ExbB/TolQ
MITILYNAFTTSDALGKLILCILVILSLYSWTVLITEYLSFRRANRAGAGFMKRFEATRDNPLSLFGTSTCTQFNSASIVRVYESGCRRLEGLMRESRTEGVMHISTKRLLDIEDAMAMTISSESLQMEMRLGSLATISSVSPLLGLFGTVWGIMLSFHYMGITGSTSIRTVAPGLTVALVTTVCGLGVAIPAMVGHNILASQVRLSVSRMRTFALEFISLVEKSGC